MLGILDRYILRESAQNWAGITGILLLILMSNRFARFLGDAAAGRLPTGPACLYFGTLNRRRAFSTLSRTKQPGT